MSSRLGIHVRQSFCFLRIADCSLFILRYLSLPAISLIMNNVYLFEEGATGLTFFSIVVAAFLGLATNVYQEKLYTKNCCVCVHAVMEALADSLSSSSYSRAGSSLVRQLYRRPSLPRYANVCWARWRLLNDRTLLLAAGIFIIAFSQGRGSFMGPVIGMTIVSSLYPLQLAAR